MNLLGLDTSYHLQACGHPLSAAHDAGSRLYLLFSCACFCLMILYKIDYTHKGRRSRLYLHSVTSS